MPENNRELIEQGRYEGAEDRRIGELMAADEPQAKEPVRVLEQESRDESAPVTMDDATAPDAPHATSDGAAEAIEEQVNMLRTAHRTMESRRAQIAAGRTTRNDLERIDIALQEFDFSEAPATVPIWISDLFRFGRQVNMGISIKQPVNLEEPDKE